MDVDFSFKNDICKYSIACVLMREKENQKRFNQFRILRL